MGPATGAAADLANAAIYAMRGKYIDAAASVVGAYPFGGTVAKYGAKLAGKAAASEGGELLGKKIMKHVAQAARRGLSSFVRELPELVRDAARRVKCVVTGTGCFVAGTLVVTSELPAEATTVADTGLPFGNTLQKLGHTFLCLAVVSELSWSRTGDARNNQQGTTRTRRTRTPGKRTNPDAGITVISIESLSKTAVQLANTQWTWEWGAIQSDLKSLGWTKSASVGERDTYCNPQSVAADVYHDNRKPEFIELCFAVFTDAESLDDLEYDDKAAEFYEAFKQGTSAIAKHLGRPVFSNGAAAKGFPSDQDAEWLSLWKLPTCRLMFQQKHEDRDLPFRLCIVVAPR